ncbi:L,D-transpeptidase family protein [Streptomyces sp. SID5785]|uniref:L,D-transpeptidase n=1 Tax=Streptomyces sp. SID5785 TaxID=2690309 RepID=UPI0013618F3E|nr:L,D-transpeptidase [Streptomyces sp. SID5785]MZD09579.1 L,D-transpeptidase family protein [Streptomyces sp. SID5785]
MKSATAARLLGVLTAPLLCGLAACGQAHAATAGAGAAAACTAPTGPYQRQLEKALDRPVDGVQSEADCAAIRDLQTRHKMSRKDGYADLGTYRTLVALQARPNPNAAGHCPVRASKVTCVDLDRQLLWVQQGKKIPFPATPIRSGRDTEETRPGWHTIYWRDIDHVSTIYDNAPMPYSQFFDGGQALHGHPGELFDGGGSAGCVNLTVKDAKTLWNLLAKGDKVYVWGTKPGTRD